MKQFLFYLTTMVFMTIWNIKAQNQTFENDAKTIDALIKASYEVVSGEKGAKRQWERDNYLHHPKAIYSYFDRQKQEQVSMTYTDHKNLRHPRSKFNSPLESF